MPGRCQLLEESEQMLTGASFYSQEGPGDADGPIWPVQYVVYFITVVYHVRTSAVQEQETLDGQLDEHEDNFPNLKKKHKEL